MKHKKKFRKKNKHHMKHKSRHEDSRDSNLLTIDIEKHNLLHKVFGTLTWREIILVMIRTAKLKHYENIEPKIAELYKFI